MSEALTLENWLRFWSKVDKTGKCWNWTRFVDGQGYARFSMWRGNASLAHRVAYASCRGEIPQGYEIDHLCRNHSCVNPAHLEVVSHKENLNRGIFPWMNRTHCPHGHLLSSDNLMPWVSGRRCLKCHRSRNSECKRRSRRKIKEKR